MRILDTRKTTPGLRALEKEAVRAGGGVNHREGLFDAILVKENHSTLAGGVPMAARLAVEAARSGSPVEVECATLDDVAGALDAGVPRLLLDNMAPIELRAAVELGGGRAELEASGGITLETGARGGGDRRRLHQRRRADALGAGARRQPAARPPGVTIWGSRPRAP